MRFCSPLAPPRSRAVHGWVLLAAMIGVVGIGPITSGPAPVYAFQNDNDAEAEAAPEAAPETEPAAEQDGEPAAVDEELEARKQESFLEWMIRASGIFGLLILLLSFVMVALIMMCLLQIRRENLIPSDFIDAFEQRINARDYQAAYELAKNDDSFVARVLAAGLSRLNRGYNEAVEGMQEAGEDENMALEHRLSYLAMIGTIGPMLGLMGTVWGMIASFQVIATSTTSPKPYQLADGIATALFTTLEGLAVAIPAMMFYGFLRNRTSRLVLEVGMVSEGLMSRLPAVGRRPAAGGTAPATAPAAPQQP
ncbi:MAG: MotA/TolQ/ExbB proton channel family protein [Planctomycetaceae bacterium]